MPDDLKTWLRNMADGEGFSACRIASPGPPDQLASRLRSFLGAGFHGDMNWMQDTADRRADPSALWPDVRSIIMLAFNYGPSDDPLADHQNPGKGVISCYAQGKDYHEIIKPKLIRIARALDTRTGTTSRVFVDTAPLMEKPLAARSGIGWQGKHTNLVSRSEGSWTFLGAILTASLIEPDNTVEDHCGSCSKCLEVCPTDAFPAPYRLDARKCIAYLTIEHKGHIPRHLRRPMANRIFGCDDCLAVCPWNKFAKATSDLRLHPRIETHNPPLTELLCLDDEAFRKRFAGTPVKRTGRNRFLRNVLIASGNTADRALVPLIEPHLTDPDPIVRLAAVWSLAMLLEPQEFDDRRTSSIESETDLDVRGEWFAHAT